MVQPHRWVAQQALTISEMSCGSFTDTACPALCWAEEGRAVLLCSAHSQEPTQPRGGQGCGTGDPCLPGEALRAGSRHSQGVRGTLHRGEVSSAAGRVLSRAGCPGRRQCHHCSCAGTASPQRAHGLPPCPGQLLWHILGALRSVPSCCTVLQECPLSALQGVQLVRDRLLALPSAVPPAVICPAQTLDLAEPFSAVPL